MNKGVKKLAVFLLVLLMAFATNMIVFAETRSDIQTFELQQQIQGFVDKEPFCLTYGTRPTKNKILDDLPSSLEVRFGDGTSKAISVSWECVGDFDVHNNYYYYEFDPVFSSSYSIEVDDVPYAAIFIVENGDSHTSMGTTNRANEEKIFNYLTKTMKLNEAAACGILANIQAESSYNPLTVGDGGQSFGICQWYKTRQVALKNYCEKNQLNYQTLDGQLAYLQYELSKNYSSVLKTIKEVENTSTGAFNAAYIWCYKFEIPANKEAVSVTRGNLAKKTIWPKYKGSTSNSSSADGTISIIDESKPNNMSQGEYFLIKGTIYSSSKIKSLTVGVYNNKGEDVIVKTVSPNAKTFNLSKIDDDLIFGTLSPGGYQYKVIVKTNAKKKELISKSFVVKPSQADLKTLTPKKGKKLEVSWTRDLNVNGYQIQYGLNKNFSGAKINNVIKNEKEKKEISSLKADKKYYVRIRKYITVNGKKYTGEWSKEKLSKKILK